MSVLDTKDHSDLALEVAKQVKSVVAVGGGSRGGVGCVIGAQCAGVNVGCEVSDTACDAGVELTGSVSLVGDKKNNGRLTAARTARCPPRHMPVAPIRPVQVDRERRWSTVAYESASYDSRV